VFSQKDAAVEEPAASDLHAVGTLARVVGIVKQPSGTYAIVVEGVARLELEDLQNAGTQNAMLLAAGLQTLLLAALWYAPLLVAWAGLGAPKAVFFSAAAAFINWRAFLAYGAGMALLFGFVLLLALASAAMFGGSRALQANSAAFAVLWTLLPVWFASSYLSFHDVFEAQDGPGGEPPKSPTMPS